MDKQQRKFRDVIVPLQIMILVTVTFGVGVLFGTQISNLQAQGNNTTLSNEAMQAFSPVFQTYNLIENQYIDEIEVTALIDGAINGMVEALDDQYSGYVDPTYFPYMDANLSGEIEGIGVTIQENELGEIEVANILEGTPAERSGVKIGDIFYIVDGEEVIGNH